MRTTPLLVAALVAAVVAAVGLAGSGPGPRSAGVQATEPPLGPLVGIVPERRRRWLVRVDPDRLRSRSGRRIDVGTEGCVSRAGGTACSFIPPWTVSPDRSRLALARHEAGALRSLRLVDVRRMRVAADVRLTGGPIGLLAWPARERVLAVQELCCDGRQQLLVVDLAQRRVAASRPLEGSVLLAEWTARELVLLLAPAQRIGPARLAIVDADGAVRLVGLERIRAGRELVDPVRHEMKQSVPGLAVDGEGRRAFVVAPGVVASVDLANGTVGYHRPARSRSLLSRLRDWLDPVAQAKGASGPIRSARWLGGGLLAVTGTDESPTGELEARLRPAGLDLVDTRNWTKRTIDRDVNEVRVAGDLLLATGSSAGLSAYGFDGHRRFRLLEGRETWIEHVHGARAYVHSPLPDGRLGPLLVVDLATGSITTRRRQLLPWLVAQPAWGWWDD
jgi:hypothetical protein